MKNTGKNTAIKCNKVCCKFLFNLCQFYINETKTVSTKLISLPSRLFGSPSSKFSTKEPSLHLYVSFIEEIDESNQICE
ncbi:hypothetical protein BpHYR1_050040 [Brachionus plicatilis]|uniref:Uncharacterized protein n=1 Tax=Brachionus plicatilis TaxID=10195 RepID=A0A3M7R6M8_BRAPC|nr:hypothetical protein BpHYR1_050040 [Brachionus plicatilis]